MSTFAENRRLALPVVVRGENGRAWATALGSAQDGELALLRAVGLLRSVKDAPDDALDDIGSRSNIERYTGESDASYRARLLDPWGTWDTSGSPDSIETQIRAYGIPDVVVTYGVDAPFSPGASYSIFIVTIGTDYGTTGIEPVLLGSWTLGDSTTLGSTATLAQIRALKRIILKWKSAYGYPDAIVVTFTSAPTIRWNMGRTLGDSLPTLGSAGCKLGGYQI